MNCNLEKTPTTHSKNAPSADLLKQAGAFIRNDDDAGLLRYLQRSWSQWKLAQLLDGDDSAGDLEAREMGGHVDDGRVHGGEV